MDRLTLDAIIREALDRSSLAVTVRQTVALLKPAASTPIPFASNWASYDASLPDSTVAPAGSWKDAAGTIHLEGLARRTTSTFSFPSVIGTLAAAHRPAKTHTFACYSVDSASNRSVWRVTVTSAGVITGVDSAGGGTANGGIGTLVSLDGISFRS